MTKDECRQKSSAFQKSLGIEQVDALSVELVPQLDQLFAYLNLPQKRAAVAVYRGFGKELRLEPWLRTLSNHRNLTLVMPVFMNHWAWQKITLRDFLSDVWVVRGDGTSTPSGSKLDPLKAMDPLDLALIPGQGFSEHGARVGRGKGHYDQLLSAEPLKKAFKIGVTYDGTVFDTIQQDPWDVQMDGIVTPTRLVLDSFQHNFPMSNRQTHKS